MCNCGNKRNELSRQPAITTSTVSNSKNVPADIQFEYTGLTALSITGTVTGKKYRFHQPNDVQVIDYRDAPAMTGVPVLKKIIKN